jgi:hypothetical protein
MGGIHRHAHCWDGILKFAVEMGATTYIPSFIKIGGCIQKLI